MSAERFLTEALHAQVAAFRTPEFSLAADLNALDRLQAGNEADAVVFYAARILEVLTREALGPLCVPKNLALSLCRLREHQGLPDDTHSLQHRLRELGNAARHVLRPIGRDDAEVAYAILLRKMHWFFCERSGAALTGLFVPGRPLASWLRVVLARLSPLLDAATAPGQDVLAVLKLDDPGAIALLSPVVPAVAAEALINAGRLHEADAVLDVALRRFPTDPRLRLMRGLHLSRSGRLDEVLTWLEALEAAGPAPDDELRGILAGVYKRRATSDPTRHDDWLTKAHELYRRGWLESGSSNAYLGINAASTALWLGRRAASATLATQVRELLMAQRTALGDRPTSLGFWDTVTLAEAHLLEPALERACDFYRDAAQHFPGHTGDLAVSRSQAERILQHLGLADRIDEVFPT